MPDGGKLEVGPPDAGQRVPGLGTSTSRRNFEEILLGQLLVRVDLVDVAGFISLTTFLLDSPQAAQLSIFL